MNVMHDGNHGSYYSRLGEQVYRRNQCIGRKRIQLAQAMWHHTYTNIPGHDEDLDAGRIIDLPKMLNGITYRFQQYYSVFLYGLLTFNWAITTDFEQMKSYLKENYLMVKLSQKLWTTLIITSDLRFNLDCIAYHHRNHMVESTNRFFCDALHCRINLERCFSITHIVEETTNPSPNELEKWIIRICCSQQLILRLKRNCKLVHRWVKPSNRTSYISKHQSHSLR
jgi:linoleoyl-CoA desaturase